MFWQRLFFWRREKRDIFTFWDGRRKRSIDPLPAWWALWNDPECHPPRDFPAADNGDRDAWNRIQAMAQRSLGIKGFADGGLTEGETSVLLGEFIAYTIRLKKKQEQSRMLWEHMVGELPEELRTPPGSESSSTPDESSSEEPSPSSPPSPPPLET